MEKKKFAKCSKNYAPLMSLHTNYLSELGQDYKLNTNCSKKFQVQILKLSTLKGTFQSYFLLNYEILRL